MKNMLGDDQNTNARSCRKALGTLLPFAVLAGLMAVSLAPTANASGSAIITKSGSAWTLENDVLRSVIVFTNGGIDITSFYNKQAAKEYLTGAGARHLFQYTYGGSNLTANGGGWSLGTDAITDINVFGQVWGQQLAVDVSMTAPQNVGVKLVFEIYNGRAGLKYSTFIKNNDVANQNTITASDVIALNFPTNAHTLYYVPQAITWAGTTGSLAAAKENCLACYDTGDGWVVSPENNHATSLVTGANTADPNNPFLFIDAWNGAPNNVRVYSNPKAVQLVLFPGEQVEYFSVNLEVFQGDIWDGRKAAAEHFRERFKYQDPTRILSVNDWYFSNSGTSRPETYLRSAVVPALQQMGFDMLQIDEFWSASRDSTTPNAQTFTTNLPAFADWVNAQGLKIGYWFSLTGDGWGLGRDLADPANIAFKESQMDTVLIPLYHTRWQQIDLGELFMNGTATSYSHPGDSVYRKFLGFKAYCSYMSHKYPDILFRETCEFENVAGSAGSSSLMAINDNAVSGLFWGATGAASLAKDLFSYFGQFPAEGMLGFFDKNSFGGTVNDLCQMLTARDIGVYTDPATLSSQRRTVIRQFTDWMRNPRIKSILNEVACPTSFGGTFDNLADPYLWMFVNEAKDTAILAGESAVAVPAVTADLRWLDSGKIYLVEDISLDDDGLFQYAFKGKWTGGGLKSPGFAVDFSENTSFAKVFWMQELVSTNPQVLYADANITSYSQQWDGSSLVVSVTGTTNTTGTVVAYKDSAAGAETKNVSLGPDGLGTVTFDASTITLPVPPPVNLALGKAASASSVWSAGYEAGKANDGSLSTRWNSAAGQFNNQWLQIDLGTPTTFDKVVTREHTGDGCGERIQSYQIQYWNGSDWINVANGATVGSYQADEFTPVSGSKVRLYISAASNTPTIDEFMVFRMQVVNTTPTNLNFSLGSGQLTLTWPADHVGWRFQAQTNELSRGLSTNWFDVVGSTITNQITVPASPSNPTSFYRLVYP